MFGTCESAPIEMTHEELTRRRHELWRTLKDRGVPICDCAPTPLPTSVIAALFNVTPRAVNKGIANAELIKGALSNVFDDRATPNPTTAQARAGLPA